MARYRKPHNQARESMGIRESVIEEVETEDNGIGTMLMVVVIIALGGAMFSVGMDFGTTIGSLK